MPFGSRRAVLFGTTTGSPVISNWLLATGFWNDSGVWDDTAFWIG